MRPLPTFPVRGGGARRRRVDESCASFIVFIPFFVVAPAPNRGALGFDRQQGRAQGHICQDHFFEKSRIEDTDRHAMPFQIVGGNV